MNTYKYKEAGNDEYIKLTTPEGEETIKSPSFNEKNSPERFKEMMDSGLEIEPQFTAEELEAKTEKENSDALVSQDENCKNILRETDHKEGPRHKRKFPDDELAWEVYRDAIGDIIGSDVLVTLPKKPF